MAGKDLAQERALLAAIAAAPDDEASYLVYGDWLQASGDRSLAALGELIAIMHAGADTDEGDAAQLIDEVLGPLAPLTRGDDPVLAPVWHLGLLADVRVDLHQSGIATLRRLLDHPAAGALRSLRLIHSSSDGVSDYQPAVDLLVERPMATLRHLSIAHDYEYEPWCPDVLEEVNVGDLAPLYARYPDLESLHLQGDKLHLGAVDLPSLRSLEIVTNDMAPATLRSVVAASWPSLERLTLFPANQNDRGTGLGTADVLAPILDGDRCPRLCHLAINMFEFGDDLCRRLVDAPLLPRLRSLRLQWGWITDDGARALADRAAAFRHLEEVVITSRACGYQSGDPDDFTDEGERLLRKLAPNVTTNAEYYAEQRARRAAR